MDVVGGLEVSLVLAGHGRPVRDAPGLVEANRREVRRRLEAVRGGLAAGPALLDIAALVAGDVRGIFAK
jgi:hypothetical protein